MLPKVTLDLSLICLKNITYFGRFLGLIQEIDHLKSIRPQYLANRPKINAHFAVLTSYTNILPPIFPLIVLVCNLYPTSLAGILESADALLELAGCVTNTGNHNVVAAA